MSISYTKPPRDDLNEKDFFEEERVLEIDEKGVPYTVCYIGPYSYVWDAKIDVPLESLAVNDGLSENLHIGKCCCISQNCQFIMASNGEHNLKAVSNGAFAINMRFSDIPYNDMKRTNINKGNIIIQNDVWIGTDCTIMGGVIIRNGAVVARNSHVVSDVPAYAIVGGNPAKIIGYKFPREVIDKLQIIQWWNWDKDKLIRYNKLFDENVEEFCGLFYQEAKEKYDLLVKDRNVMDDAYFLFVDYYENYNSYEKVIEEFLNNYLHDGNKRLILFIRNDLTCVNEIDEDILFHLNELTRKVTDTDIILCKIQVIIGNLNMAQKEFIQCSHYIANRVFNTVDFSCLADLLGMDIISGVDSHIAFHSVRNIIYRE